MRRTSSLALIPLLLLLICPATRAEGSLGSPLPLPQGDWVVRTPFILTDVTITLRGNLVVKQGGSLELRGVTVRMEGDHDGERRILVENGGRLAALPSFFTRRRTAIVRGDGPGRYAFDVAPGGQIELAGATISGAGWDDDHPGLVIDAPAAQPGDEPAIVDCEFVDNYVGLTLRRFPGEVAWSRLHRNRRAGLVLDGSPARISFVEVRDQPTGILARAVSQAVVRGSLFSGHELGLWSLGSSLEIEGSLFLDNALHARIEGNGGVVHDNLFVVASEAALVATGGAAPILRFNDFVFNAFGVRNENPLFTPSVDAAENYWGSEIGPGGAGEGDGDAVSEGVDYTPWCAGSCRGALQRRFR